MNLKTAFKVVVIGLLLGLIGYAAAYAVMTLVFLEAIKEVQ